jgi:serine/threonine-protein kinase
VLRKEVPNGLEDVVARCLKKDASARFATIAELAQALGNFVPEESRRSVARISRLLGVPVSAPVQQFVISRHPSHDPHSTTVPSWEGLTTLTSTKTRRRALGLALVAAVVAAFIGLLSRGGVFSSPSGPPSSGPVVATSTPVVAAPPPPVVPPQPPSSAGAVPGALSAELSDKEKPPKPAPSADKDPRRRPRGEPRKSKNKQEPDDGTSDRK